MKRLKYIAFLFFSILLFPACEDVIEIDVPDGDTKLVVDGLIYNQDTSHLITLSTTAPYFDKERTPRVTGARVFILSTAGDSIGFNEKEFGSGEYFADHIFKEGIEYYLNVITPEGRIYRSHSEQLLRVPPLELYQSEEFLDSIGGFRPEGYYVSLRTIEPAGLGDYYRWIVFINGEQQIAPEYTWIADDQLVDGNVIEEVPGFFIYGMLPGDSVSIHQTSISARVFNFWILVTEQLFNSGSPFDTPPASIPGNIYSLSDPDEVVLGIFSVSKVERASIIVK